MNVCSLDWELVIKFLPLVNVLTTVVVAFAVYKVWHIQKAKEVIANEAKSIINDLNLIYEEAYKLQDLLLAGKLDELRNQIKVFTENRNNIDLNMNLFNTLVEVNFKKKDIQLENYKIKHLGATFQLVGKINFILEKDNDFIYKNQGIIVDERGKYQDFNLKIKYYIANYAVYKNPKSA